MSITRKNTDEVVFNYNKSPETVASFMKKLKGTLENSGGSIVFSENVTIVKDGEGFFYRRMKLIMPNHQSDMRLLFNRRTKDILYGHVKNTIAGSIPHVIYPIFYGDGITVPIRMHLHKKGIIS